MQHDPNWQPKFKKGPVYALLHKRSGGTFVEEETMKRLCSDGHNKMLRLKTLHNTKEIAIKVFNGLVAVNYQKEDVHLDLP